MTSIMPPRQNDYPVGGSVPLSSDRYVERQADQDLYEAVRAGQFCYVFNSRQMGKSSLRVRTLSRLQAEGVACASIDITEIGSDAMPEQFYGGMIDLISNSLGLASFDLYTWWESHALLSPVQRFSKFLAEVLLQQIQVPVVIFVDEIDSVLSLQFSVDDFFAVIRDCYNRRADREDFMRLTFVLLGVASPTDLIQDQKRTPFNVGREIELTGFQLQEVTPLAQGLVDLTSNPQAVMTAILRWTGGQPFLTQKVCQLLRQAGEPIPLGLEAAWVDRIVQTRIIDNWEAQDQPVHLKTIHDRILYGNHHRMGRLLGLYQQILQKGAVPADHSPEQMELRLSGLVTKRGNQLQVYNPIYATVFSLAKTEAVLANLRPYGEALAAWVESNQQDNSRLLRGQALADAIAWAADKSLSQDDYHFLGWSQNQELLEAESALSLQREQNLLAEQKADAAEAARKIVDQARKKAVRLSMVSLILLGLSVVTAIAAGLMAHRATMTTRAAELRLADADAKSRLLEGKILSALITSLQTAQQVRQISEWGQQFDATKMQVATTLQTAVFFPGWREAQTMRRHEDGVEAVSWSPDGQTLATGSADKTVKLWRQDGSLITTLKGHGDRVYSISWSPDGQMLATGSRDKTVKLWRKNGSLITTLKGHGDRVYSVSWSPDGQTLATGSQDRTVKIWRKDGSLIATLKGHGDKVYSVSWSSDSQVLATGSKDKTVKLWRKNGALISILRGHGDEVYSISWSPDGQTLATGGADKTVKLWRKNGALISTLNNHEDEVYSISWSPDGQTLATGGADKTVKLWRKDGFLITTLKGHNDWILAIDWSPDGKTLVTGSGDKTVKLWRQDSFLTTTLNGQESWIWPIAWNPNGQTLATGSGDKSVKLWHQDGSLINALKGHGARVWSVSWSPDGETLTTASRDKTVKLWRQDGSLISTLIGHQGEVLSASWNPDGQILATGSGDKTVKLWRKDGSLISTLKGHGAEVWSVSWSPDGQTLATGSGDRTVKLWRKDGSLISTLIGHEDEVLSVTWNPDGQTLATGSGDRTVKLWRKDGALITALNGHGYKVWSISWSPDGQVLATASQDRTVKLWRPDGSLISTLKGHEDGVLSVSWSPDGRTLAVGSENKIVKFWSLDLDSLTALGCYGLRDYLMGDAGQQQQLPLCQDAAFLKATAVVLVDQAKLLVKAGRVTEAKAMLKTAKQYNPSLGSDVIPLSVSPTEKN